MNRKPSSVIVRSAQAGFTLIEIMVVIVILGLLATLVVPNVVGMGDDAKLKVARADVKSLADAVKLYRVTKGSLPDTLEVLTQRNDKGTGNFLDELKQDPWDHDYELRVNTPHDWEVVSLGPDGVRSEDDISSKTQPSDK